MATMGTIAMMVSTEVEDKGYNVLLNNGMEYVRGTVSATLNNMKYLWNYLKPATLNPATLNQPRS